MVSVQIPPEIFISQSVALNFEALANTVEGYIAANRPDSVGCSRSHVHNGASHVHRVRVRFCGH